MSNPDDFACLAICARRTFVDAAGLSPRLTAERLASVDFSFSPEVLRWNGWVAKLGYDYGEYRGEYW